MDLRSRVSKFSNVKIASCIALIAGLPLIMAFGEIVPVTTAPVGYVKMGAKSPAEGVPTNSDYYMAVPLLKPALLRGKVSTIVGNTISISEATAPISLSGPHYFIIESGSKNGLIALISSSTTNSVTIELQPGETFSEIVAGNKISITPAWTLKSLFKEILPAGTKILMWSNSNTMGQPPPDLIYQFDGTDWNSVRNNAISNDVVVYPGETFIVRTGSQSIPKLTMTGEASQIKSRVPILGFNVPTFSYQSQWLHYFTSTKETILTSGIISAQQSQEGFAVYHNFTPAPNRTADYNCYFWGGYIYSSADSEGNFYFEDSYPIDSNFKFDPAISGMIFIRAGIGLIADHIWSDFPDYLPIH